ncbi:MAG: hypothetical protein CM15mP58_19740 [Burkholderiaceae bacterium]|nr:MAG: hypothetical protein CM15mP58_19740 [Burkholderiaceae bacterium]
MRIWHRTLVPKCGNVEEIFGSGGGFHTAKKYDTNFLGSLPLNVSIREDSDNGVPSVISKSNPGIAKAYGDVSFALARHISALKEE